MVRKTWCAKACDVKYMYRVLQPWCPRCLRKRTGRIDIATMFFPARTAQMDMLADDDAQCGPSFGRATGLTHSGIMAQLMSLH